MDTRQLAQTLITNLGATLTLPELKLDDSSNSCVLLFDADIVLNIEYDDAGRQLILSAYLDELASDDNESLLRELMMANLYWHRTDGATLGLEEATNSIIIAQARNVTELDDSSFEKMVETFVNQTERWKLRLREAKSGQPVADVDGGSRPLTPSDAGRIFG